MPLEWISSNTVTIKTIPFKYIQQFKFLICLFAHSFVCLFVCLFVLFVHLLFVCLIWICLQYYISDCEPLHIKLIYQHVRNKCAQWQELTWSGVHELGVILLMRRQLGQSKNLKMNCISTSFVQQLTTKHATINL